MCKMSGFIRDGCESEVNPFLKRSLQKDCEKFCRRIGVPPFSLKNKCVLNASKWPETKFGNFFSFFGVKNSWFYFFFSLKPSQSLLLNV